MKQAIVKFPSETSYSESHLQGYVLFTQDYKDSVVKVEVNLYGLKEGVHGFHIHEHPIKKEYINEMKKGKKVKDLCKTLGGHFNPFKTNHGSYRYNTERHAGDLINNLYVKTNGIVYLTFLDPLISLYKCCDNCIINKSVVIHDKYDDEGLPGLIAKMNNKPLNENEKESLKTGNAGKRIACGNIVETL